MQFKVPQFLEIEDKIFGPFTFRQFVYMAGGAGICFMLYRILGLWIGMVPIALIAAFSLALAFYKPNDKPFIEMVQSVIRFGFQNKLYIWQKAKAESADKEKQNIADEYLTRQNESRLNRSKLRDLAWSLDVLDVNKHKAAERN